MSLRRDRKKIAPPAPDRLPAVIEGLLFVAEEPQEIGVLARSVGATRQRVERAVEELVASTNGRGLFIQRLGDRVQIATVPDAAPYIEHFLEVEHGRLSRAALETLAIICYRQPVTRANIEAVRGVNADHAVATLQARGLIEDVGRAPGPGRPVLFGTTVRFLEYFGLQRPEDMPALPELEELVTSDADEVPEDLRAEGSTEGETEKDEATDAEISEAEPVPVLGPEELATPEADEIPEDLRAEGSTEDETEKDEATDAEISEAEPVPVLGPEELITSEADEVPEDLRAEGSVDSETENDEASNAEISEAEPVPVPAPEEIATPQADEVPEDLRAKGNADSETEKDEAAGAAVPEPEAVPVSGGEEGALGDAADD